MPDRGNGTAKILVVRPEGIELSHTAPEAAALSTELRAYIGYANYYSIEWCEGQIFVIIFLSDRINVKSKDSTRLNILAKFVYSWYNNFCYI